MTNDGLGTYQFDAVVSYAVGAHDSLAVEAEVQSIYDDDCGRHDIYSPFQPYYYFQTSRYSGLYQPQYERTPGEGDWEYGVQFPAGERIAKNMCTNTLQNEDGQLSTSSYWEVFTRTEDSTSSR